MKGKQTDLRTLWTITILLDGEEKNQTEIVKLLKGIGKKLRTPNEDTTEANQLIKTTKAIESPIIKHLTDQNIIKGKLKDLKGSNLKANFCTISNDLETFINILNEINSSNIDETRKKFFISKLIDSEIGQKQINQELIIKLFQKNKMYQMELKSHEKSLIQFILFNSPQALKYTIESIKNKNKEWKHSKSKEYYIYKIQTLFTLDVLDEYLDIDSNRSNQQLLNIQFDTNMSFKKNKPTNQDIKAEISSENIHLFLQSNINNEKTQLLN